MQSFNKSGYWIRAHMRPAEKDLILNFPKKEVQLKWLVLAQKQNDAKY